MFHPDAVTARLAIFRESLGLNKSEMADRLGLKQRAYNFYEAGERKLSPETMDKLAGLGLNLNWLTTGAGQMLSAVGRVEAMDANDTAQAYGHVGEALSRPDESMLQGAAALLDELVFKGRPWKDSLKREMVEQVAEQMLELRYVGYSGMALDREIRKRILVWLQLASGPEKGA